MVQSILVAGIGHNRCLNYHTCFWPDWSPRTASIPLIEFCYLRLLGHRFGRDLSGDASFNFGDGELINSVLSRLQPEHFASRRFVVAGRFRAHGLLFHLHLATLRGENQRSVRY